MIGNATQWLFEAANANRAALRVLPLACTLAACSVMPAAGPSSRAIDRSGIQRASNSAITVIDLTDDVARRVLASVHTVHFSDSLGDGHAIGSIIGQGDVLEVGIWEAPPATLFGSYGGEARLPTGASANQSSRNTSLPEQMVDSDGMIVIPFVGSVRAAGRTPQALAREIVERLARKAHQPQALVRIVQNATNNVTVVGDVVNSARLPLTSKGERLLDVLAMAGGVKQPVGKVTIQVSRGDKSAAMPLESVIRDPSQNIRLQSNDVVTALYQPFSFTALGATGSNAEVNFEATGLTLAQALGRVAGLQDFRADVKGVFLFRMEDQASLDPVTLQNANSSPEGKVPVIYRVDMKNPATFFVAQSFPVRNRDILYVSNAPLADIQKFVNVISSTILPVATASTIAR